MRLLAMLAALGAAALIPIMAGASDHKAETRVAFVAIVPFGGGYSYEGTIESKRKCANGRKVVVFRVQPGKNERIGATNANGSVGAWSVQHPDTPDGTYYAKAPPTSECQGDKSGKLSI